MKSPLLVDELVPAPERALCVSIHDVAAPTWSECRQLIAALRAVGDFPLGLLLVPRWHGHRLHDDPGFVASLQGVLDAGPGHEVLLHGLYHRDDGSAPTGVRSFFQRHILTHGEGEFAVLGAAAALARVGAGLDDLQRCGLRDPDVRGFLPPAWLMSGVARSAIVAQGSALGLHYASLFTGLLDLRNGGFVLAPALVYSVRSRVGDAVARAAVGAMAEVARRLPLLRLGLHPADVRRPQNLRHAQRLVEQALRDRTPTTEGRWLQNHMGKF